LRVKAPRIVPADRAALRPLSTGEILETSNNNIRRYVSGVGGLVIFIIGDAYGHYLAPTT
jgi:hypothetical protein